MLKKQNTNEFVNLCNCISIKRSSSNYTILINNTVILSNCKNFSYLPGKLFTTYYNNNILIFRILEKTAYLALSFSSKDKNKSILIDNTIYLIDNEGIINFK